MYQKSVLRDLLSMFLSGKQDIQYPPIECSILQLNPLSITDDNLHYIDLLAHAEIIETKLRYSKANSFTLLLKSWNFVLRQIPSNHEAYYFDVEIKDFSIRENFYVLQLSQQPIKLIDDPELSYQFEERRKIEVEKQQLGFNQNLFNPRSGKSSLSKSDLSSFSGGTGLNPILPFNPSFGGTFTPTYKVQKKSDYAGKGSLAKSIGYQKSEPIVEQPFFRDSGVKKPHKIIKPTVHRLSLEDIEDVEAWYPIVEEILILKRIPA